MDHVNFICQIFPGDTSLFLPVHDKNSFWNELKNHLQKIKDWTFQWKMSFNPDFNKQTQNPDLRFQKVNI